MPTLPAPDHDRASAEWIVNDVWLSYPDLRAWLAGAFVSNEQLYAEYVNAVEVINADLMVLRQFRRSARDEDMARRREEDPLMVHVASVRFYNEMLRAQAAALGHVAA